MTLNMANFYVDEGSAASNLTNNTPPRYVFPTACYLHQDLPVCLRIALLLLLVIVSGLLLFFRVLQYHIYRNRNYSQYIVFYTGLVIVLLLIVHITYFYQGWLDFVAIFLVIFQLNVILLSYSSWASRLLRMEKIMYFIIPLALVMLLAFFVICVWAFCSYGAINQECTKPQWLIFSISQFILVQLYTVIVWYIIRKTRRVRTVLPSKLYQKGQLIFIVVIFQVMSIFALVYDTYMMVASGQSHCTEITGSEWGDISLEVIRQTIKFLLPQLAIVIVFAPRRPASADTTIDDSPGLARAYNYGSFDPDKDPLLSLPINQPVPTSSSHASPEDYRNYPSLPKSTPYTPTTGYNYYTNNPYKSAFSGSQTRSS